MLVWHNLDHSEQVDAGRTGHVAKADESTSAILKLKPNNEYSLRVSITYELFASIAKWFHFMDNQLSHFHFAPFLNGVYT